MFSKYCAQQFFVGTLGSSLWMPFCMDIRLYAERRILFRILRKLRLCTGS